MRRPSRTERRLEERAAGGAHEDDLPSGVVPCCCGGDCRGRRYTCPRCLRFVPECFGAADELDEVCDDCFGQLHGTPAARAWADPTYAQEVRPC